MVRQRRTIRLRRYTPAAVILSLSLLAGTVLALPVGASLTLPVGVHASARASLAAPVAPADGLSGAWQVSRTCLTVCKSPKPVSKIVSHLGGGVFVIAGPPREMLYRVGARVLVHGLKDSLMLTVDAPGSLMSGYGVGADGSTFKTTWRCVAAPRSAASAAGVILEDISKSSPAQMPLGMGFC